MGDTAEGEWVARVLDVHPVAGGLPLRVLLDDGREVVATLPRDLPRPPGPPSLGQRVEVRTGEGGAPPQVVAFLKNRGPRSPFLRVSGWRDGGDVMRFIVTVRMYTAVDLGTAKGWVDGLRSDGSIELYPPDASAARPLGVDLLRLGGVAERVELVYPDGRPTEALAPPSEWHGPTIHPCPPCAMPLKNRAECAHCGWLKHPGDATRWGTQGACGQCGFAYRWDGTRCSHCGFKTGV
jgi:hypothetical protein